MGETPVDYSKRPFAYYNIDGVGELGCGVMLLGFGSLIWLQTHAPADSAWHRQYATFLFMAPIFALIHFGSKAIKQRITYPRTGFVEYRTRDAVWRPMILGMLASGAITIALVMALRSLWDLRTLASLFMGLLFGASYAYGIARTVRWKWTVVAAIAAAALAIAWLPANFVESFVGASSVTGKFAPLAGVFLLWFLFYGPVLLISGGISFYLYLRHTR